MAKNCGLGRIYSIKGPKIRKYKGNTDEIAKKIVLYRKKMPKHHQRFGKEVVLGQSQVEIAVGAGE